MIKLLEKALSEIQLAQYHVEARESVFIYPDLYNLGRQSVHMQCKWCGLKPTHYVDADYIKDRGICFRCDKLSAEYSNEDMRGGDL